MAIRILLADDHAILRAGLQLLIESWGGYEVVGQASNALEAIALAKKHRPAVVILDITMPDGGGIHACESIKRDNDEVRVIALTMHEDPAYLKAALVAGASGYVIKRSADNCLIDAVEAVMASRIYIDPELGAQVLQEIFVQAPQDAAGPAAAAGLTLRERQVLDLLAHGYKNREIADELGLSMRSIEAYRKRLVEKTGLQTRKEIVRYALEAGLLKPGDGV